MLVLFWLSPSEAQGEKGEGDKMRYGSSSLLFPFFFNYIPSKKRRAEKNKTCS